MTNKIEIVKPMTFEVDGETYTLEFNRNSVISAERAGFRSVAQLYAEPTKTLIRADEGETRKNVKISL